MKKLLKFKEWLTIEDAAKHLSLILDDEVTSADVLQLGLDGHLSLAVFFVNGTYGRYCNPVKNVEEIEKIVVPSLDGKSVIELPRGGRIWGDERGIFQVQETVIQLDAGVWDIDMAGGGRLDVEYFYQQLTGGPEITGVTLDGVMVSNRLGDLFEVQSHYADNEYFKRELKKPFLHPDNFHPAGALPADSIIVVRTTALQEFESRVRDADSSQPIEEKPLSSRERNNLFKIINALAEIAELDLSKPYKAADIIKKNIELMGQSLSQDTIVKALENARNPS